MFQEFPKMARLTRDCVITEKIDGTNAQVHILPYETGPVDGFVIAATVANDGVTPLVMMAGSRTRYITPTDDNFNFAKWVLLNAAALWSLGEGRHYGEWWGHGIQRGYGLTEKRFSLFNTARWADDRDREKYPTDRPACCSVVPVLYRGLFGPKHADNFLDKLRAEGSHAAPGFMKPEGVVVFHAAASVMFKKTLDKDEEWKGKSAQRETASA